MVVAFYAKRGHFSRLICIRRRVVRFPEPVLPALPSFTEFLLVTGDSGVGSPGRSSETSLASAAAASASSSTAAASASASEAKASPTSYMDRVVMEVVESEAVYVRDLQQVVQVRPCLFSIFLVAFDCSFYQARLVVFV